MTLEEAVKEFLFILSIKEESDGGRIFKPNQINSCRVMDGIRLQELLEVMETKSGFKGKN
jgi:hypothetical protein